MAQPLCTYFGSCGGCSSQHIDYTIQLENKKKALVQNIKFEDVKVFSDKEYYYRNRMDMIFHPQGIGFRKKGQWQNIIDVEKCVISNEKLNNLIKEVRNFFKGVDSFDLKRHTGTYHYVVIRTPSNDSSLSFVLNEDSNNLSTAVEKVKEFSEKTTANNVIITYTSKDSDMSISDEFFAVKGKDMIREKYLGKEFLFPVQGFFQNNSTMAEKMHEYCNGLLKKYETKNASLLDLYAGVGTFGINNSALFKQVMILENDKLSIQAAEENMKNNNITNIKTTLLDAKHLGRLELQKPLFIIMDPPRSGMHPKTIEQLNILKPEVMIYISCNVEQLGKDLPKFKDYEIRSAALFDLFPQTAHCEAIVELCKKKFISPEKTERS
ncbi:MAG: 23S rRNA (uracil(1939)-C(5))-methyltransferase RlmD [Nanoarchaeota archaeon]|nr:23S rRNA (uracil(1939)-C(5))-methyltransferase RlmD [Nanoarchaeota archaeon]